MPETHDLGPIFVQRIWLQADSPLFHLAPTFELESPYRESRHSVVARIPFSNQALVFGLWRATGRDEDEALTAAVGSVKGPIDPYANFHGRNNTTKVDPDTYVFDHDDDDVDGYVTEVWSFPELNAMNMKDYANNRKRLRKIFNPGFLKSNRHYGLLFQSWPLVHRGERLIARVKDNGKVEHYDRTAAATGAAAATGTED